MKKLVALLLVTVMALSLFAGCGGNDSSDTGSAGTSGDSSGSGEHANEVVIGMDSDPGTFNPYASAAAAYQKVRLLVYQCMTYLDQDKTYTPVLAEYTEQIDDTTYKVKLKENIYDSAGNHITADDVVFSCEQHMQGNGIATWKYSDPDKPFEKTGDYEVTFYFAQKTCSAFDQMTSMVAIVSEKAYTESEDEFVNQPIGTGPYKLDNWVVGSELVFVKNENYWDDNPHKFFVQNMDKITYKVIAEAAQRAIELEIGGVDFIYDPQATDLARFESSDTVTPEVFSGSSVMNIYFNCSEYSRCQDKRMRQAVAYATDTVALAQVASEGLGTAAASIAHPIQLDWMPEYEGRILYDQDMDKAQALADELRADGVEMAFSIMTDENAMKRASATIIQEACKQIGIAVEIEQLESAVFQSRYGDLTAWDAYMGTNGSQIYVTSLMTTQIDRTGYPNPSELRDAINVAFEEWKEDTSREVVALWEEEIPILPLFYRQAAVAYNKDLKGVDLDLSGLVHPGSLSW